jgi:hypothetical protein
MLIAFEPDRGFLDIASEARADVLRFASRAGG